MAEVVWTTPALDDLRDIVGYISRDSRVYAERFATRVLEATRHLEDFPYSGRLVAEFKEENIFRTNAISQTSLFLSVKVLQSSDITHRDPRCAGSLSHLQVFFEYSERSVRDKTIRKKCIRLSVVSCPLSADSLQTFQLSPHHSALAP